MKTSIQVQNALNDMPAELPALYRRMLHKIPQDQIETANLILRWVIMAARALSPDELASLVRPRDSETIKHTQVAQDYIRLCEPLISISQDGKVTVVHQSVKDFLLKSQPDDDPVAERFRVATAEGHFSLADACLKSLNTVSAITRYANHNWPYHMKRCTEFTTRLIKQNNDFFREKSTLRQQWWRQHGEYTAQEEAMPRLHFACYLGLNHWVEVNCDFFSLGSDL